MQYRLGFKPGCQEWEYPMIPHTPTVLYEIFLDFFNKIFILLFFQKESKAIDR